jgi:hypothetical protein
MSDSNDMLNRAGGACVVGFIAFGSIFMLLVFPALVLGHLLHFTPSVGQLLGNDNGWKRHYPLVALRIAAVDVALVVALVSLSRALRRRGSSGK